MFGSIAFHQRLGTAGTQISLLSAVGTDSTNGPVTPPSLEAPLRISLFVLLMSGCSWLESDTEELTPVTVVPDSPIAPDDCLEEPLGAEQLRVAIPSSNMAIVLPKADDWETDCTRSVDPDGSAQLMSASSASQNSSAYILSLRGPDDPDHEIMLQAALTEMRQVWEMSGSVDIDRPFPSLPVAVLRATDNESDDVTWQVVTVSKSQDGEWVRIHQTWSCDGCGLDAMGAKYTIDAMVSAASGWGFPQ